MLRICGTSVSRAPGSSSATRTRACAGRTTRSSRTTVAGTGRPPTTTTTGTTRSTRHQRQRQNPCGYDSQAPCDDHGHGTHTTGTRRRRRRRRQPDRRRARREVDRLPQHGPGRSARPETYTECFQWFIAPTDLTGQNPDPTKRPDVMNNSWGCPTSELCAPDSLQQIVENTTAAGIFVEVSAGNSGSGCSSRHRPAGDLRRFLLDRRA